MPSPEQPLWDHDAVGEILAARPESVEDVAFGHGHRYTIGEDQALHVEMYPLAQVMRVTSRDARIELYRQEPPALYPEGVVFDRQTDGQQLQLYLPASGGAVINIVAETRVTPLESSLDPLSVSGDSDSLPQQTTDPSADSGARETPSPSQSPPAQRQEQEDQPRLTLFGRVGASPSFRTTRNGVLVAQFPLGVHEEDDKTAWHTIVAFKERAEKLKGSLKKGQPVEVIGYLHVSEQPAKDGATKRIEQIYAVAIKQR